MQWGALYKINIKIVKPKINKKTVKSGEFRKQFK